MFPLADASPSVSPATLGGAIVILLFLGGLLQYLRNARAALADELRRELAAQAQPQRVDVQSPLEFRQMAEFVTKTEHAKEVHEIKDELKRHASRRAEIYDGMKLQAQQISAIKATNEQQTALLAELRTDSKNTASKVDTMIGETRQLTTQLHQFTLGMQRKDRS